MKSHSEGFREGTTHITTGDPMKKGDHRRDKRRCYFYNNEYCECLSQKCTGSSQCDYYNDGIKVKFIDDPVPNLHIQEKLLMKFLQDLKYEINYKSLEGKYLRQMILKQHHLTKNDLDKAKDQIQSFEYKKTLLIKEINEYNEKLKNKCILIGLLVITAPFCYAYYQNNLRKVDKELPSLKLRIIDDDLQRKVERYNADLKQYQELSQNAKRKKACNDIKEHFFARSIQAYTNKEFERFCEMILKSIKNSTNIYAIRYLSNLFHRNKSSKENIFYSRLLLLYASYLGDKDASRILGEKILQKNKNSELGNKFSEKANN